MEEAIQYLNAVEAFLKIEGVVGGLSGRNGVANKELNAKAGLEVRLRLNIFKTAILERLREIEAAAKADGQAAERLAEIETLFGAELAECQYTPQDVAALVYLLAL